ILLRPRPRSTPFPYTTLFRSRRAGGSMRDAQSLLDQLLAFGGERLTAEQVHALLGTAQDEHVLALAAAVLDHDPGRALELFGQRSEEHTSELQSRGHLVCRLL